MTINIKTSVNPENVTSSITWTSQCDENRIETEAVMDQDETLLEAREVANEEEGTIV